MDSKNGSRSCHLVGVLLIAFVAAGCSLSARNSGAQRSDSTSAQTPSSTTVSPSESARVDSVYLSAVGATILVNTSGYPLYMFAPDRRRGVTCTGLCAAHWPPLQLPASGAPSAGPGVRSDLLGSDSDPAGGRVVTYNGWPLYLYTTDLKLGLGSAVANGQGLDIDGGYWYLMRSDGTPMVHPIPAKS